MPGRAYTIARQYADDVLAGEIVAGRLMHLACQRFLDDWEHRERKGFRWSDERAEHAHEIIGYARHWQGEWAKGADADGEPCSHGEDCEDCIHAQRVHLEAWQSFIIANLFGWLAQRDGKWLRRFTKLYAEIARKNGKSFFIAAIAYYMTFWEGVRGAQSFSAATHRDQAKIVYRHIAKIATLTPEYAPAGVRSRGDVETPRSTPKLIQDSTGSTLEPLGRENDNQDGPMPHAGVVDEYHQHPNDGVVDALETGMGTKGAEPVLLIITTAGDTTESACGEERATAIKVLRGSVPLESYFAVIFALDEEDKEAGIPADDIADESTWRKANPGLDTIVSRDYIRAKVAQALASPVKLAQVKRKHFNLWASDPRKGWVPLEVWDRCATIVPDEQLIGEECYGGVDLASVIDTTSFARVYPPSKDRPLWSIRVDVFLPSSKIEEREKRDRAAYRLWASQGWITFSEANDGEATDYSLVRAAANKYAERDNMPEIGFDFWNASQVALEMQNEDGLCLVDVRQGYKTISAPMKELERLIRARQVDHGGNPVLRWMLDNVATETDPAENIKPSKKRSTGRIDGISATITAMSRALAAVDTRSVYESRGVRSVG